MYIIILLYLYYITAACTYIILQVIGLHAYYMVLGGTPVKAINDIKKGIKS